MRRMLWAGLLAFPLLLAMASPAQAQGCASGSCGFGGGGPAWGWGTGGGSPFGCGVFCMKIFGAFHQDGPLFNYGPYEGYYPFAPYGPWNSQLQYTGPTSLRGNAAYGWNRPGCGGRLGGLFHRSGCSSCGSGGHVLGFFNNVVGRIHPFSRSGFGCHASSGCGSCGGLMHER